MFIMCLITVNDVLGDTACWITFQRVYVSN